MYQVYTQPRPGRPRWALVGSAVLLVITLGLAQGLVSYKQRQNAAALESPRDYPAGRLRCALPTGWKTQTGKLPPGVIVSATESGSADRPARSIYICRGISHSLGVASEDSAEVAVRAMNYIEAGDTKVEGVEFGRIGGLPGWTVLRVTLPTLRNSAPAQWLARGAIAPDGQALAVVLRVAGELRTGDGRLLEEVCRTTELLDTTLTSDPEPGMKAAGIHFKAPEGALFYQKRDAAPWCVRMMGGEKLGCWYLDVLRVPLVGDRHPADLVTDYALSLLERDALPAPLDRHPAGDREGVTLELALSTRSQASVLVCGVQIDKTALLCIGRFDSESRLTLRKITAEIAAGATLTGDGGLPDVAAARQRGQKMVEALGPEALRKAWSPRTRRSQTYAIRTPGIPLGEEEQEYGRDDGDWTLDVATVYPSIKLRSREVWRIRPDGRGHELESTTSILNVKESAYAEQREDGASEVLRALTVRNSGIRKRRVTVDNGYAPEPVLLEICGRLARDPQAQPTIFMNIDTFIENTAFWIVYPAGQMPLPGVGTQTAHAVRLMQDYSPRPILLYYDDVGTLIALGMDDGSWQELPRGQGSAS